MTTRVQKLAAASQELGARIQAQLDLPRDKQDLTRLVDVATELFAMEPEIQKLRRKAAETDPDRRVYGPGMVDKIAKLAVQYEASKAALSSHQPPITPESAERLKAAALESAKLQATDAPLAATRQSVEAEDAANEHQEIASSPLVEASLSAATPAEASEGGTGSEARLASANPPHRGLKDAPPSAGVGAPAAKAAESTREVGKDLGGGADRPSPPVPEERGGTDFPEVATASSSELQPSAQAPGAQNDGSLTPKAVAKDAARETGAAASDTPGDAGKRRQDAAAKERLKALQKAWLKEAGVRKAAPAAGVLPDGEPREVTDGSTELRAILQAAEGVGRAVVVDWNTSWCGPCRAMKPVLARLASEFRGRVSFVMVDCEKTPANRTLAGEAQIRAFPTFHVYQGMARKQVFQGGKSESDFRRLLEQLLVSFPPTQQPSTAAIEGLVAGLRRIGGGSGLVDASQLLITVLQNIRKNPQESKYRRLKSSNKKVQGALLSKAGGADSLSACGFTSLFEAGEQVFIGDSITVEAIDRFLPLLQEAASHPDAFVGFFSAQEEEEQGSGLMGSKSEGPVAPASAVGASQGGEDMAAQLAAQLAQLLSQSLAGGTADR